jgi:antibiotic biosynthesis monooxygenase (ABM) superfamily enzyme
LADFAVWQARLNGSIASFPGFVSLEILSPNTPEQGEWLLVQRFYAAKDLAGWQNSGTRKALFTDLENYAEGIRDDATDSEDTVGSVTEVFITQVDPRHEKKYREWMGKIHQAEAAFPGFKGVYMQSPSQGKGSHWVTLLQFDNPKNLEKWIKSEERSKLLMEGKDLIANLESHRMVSSYGGWFASVEREGQLPPVWKQTMVVLLVLFPIVMFELKYLSPLTAGLNSSLGTFIGNGVSVTLIAWPMMPLALAFLGGWVAPSSERSWLANWGGTCFVFFLYVLEIILFWKFL